MNELIPNINVCIKTQKPERLGLSLTPDMKTLIFSLEFRPQRMMVQKLFWIYHSVVII